MNGKEQAIANEAFMVGRVYANLGEKETPAEIHRELMKSCDRVAESYKPDPSEPKGGNLLLLLMANVRDVLQFSWSSNGDDAVRTIEGLRDAFKYCQKNYPQAEPKGLPENLPPLPNVDDESEIDPLSIFKDHHTTINAIIDYLEAKK